jgi:hypothetical protein
MSFHSDPCGALPIGADNAHHSLASERYTAPVS